MLHTTFGNLGEIYDGPHATPTRLASGPYFLNIASLKSGRLDLDASDHVSEEDFKHWTRRVTPEPGDLLFSYETRIGEAALMPEGVRACLGRRMALLRPDRAIVDPRFLLYYYLGPQFQRIVAQNTIHGATVPRIGLSTMPHWPVIIPNLTQQRAIAEVLGALDDKIAANSRLIYIGDQLSSAEVQRAVADGPVVRLGDILVLNYGKALPRAKRIPGEVVVYGSGGESGTHIRALVEHSGIIVGRKGTVGAVYWSNGPHYPIDTTFYVTPLIVGVDPVLYYVLRGSGLANLNSDSAVPGLNRDEAYAQSVRIPERQVLLELSAVVRQRLDWMDSVRRETARLAQTRDELLPLLMSGKLRVKDAEQIVEEIA
ncbi:hypothetical protein B0T44_08590 [Nocardia donostiensis]|uniref:Type I restriction modification DNA specificity domain-containing protein n=2 Tax=Nocardia donostiensis TaxID=1538463 RepID=A0A1W0BEZ7_9NOCA|nr:hypothetical protein B0T46_18660 [Nocardia donostiensis]OQS16596.1 hypothetical protein B0T36_02610 [Nocardia donostiensis]OQS21073.1 hypothetical protein B0T44_08590 [Nocardia donostiensis]